MNRVFKVLTSFAGIVVLVAGLSFVSVRIWGVKPEKVQADRVFDMRPEMTGREFARANSVPEPVVAAALGLRGAEGLDKRLSEFSLPPEGFLAELRKELALRAEEGSKNWKKIALKFALWVGFLSLVFVLMRRGLVKYRLRNFLYLSAVAVFGVALGSDPSPMGTVKDAVVLFGAEHVVFPPRLAALCVFLLLVVLANKFICSWGCQLGTLQDLLFRVNGGPDRQPGFLRQYKPFFAFTNTVRVLFFGVFCLIALGWGVDIIDPVDPFKLYKPAAVTLAGWGFIGVMLSLSLFVYRPWCHLFCPFGLAGWLAEKFSVFKIKVNYETCVACEACAKACPSTVMGAILKRGRVIPDCFACGECLTVCPTRSITLASGARALPPAGKFGPGK